MKARKIVLNSLLEDAQEFVSTREELSDISHDLAVALGFEPEECFFASCPTWLEWETPTDIYVVTITPITFLG